MRPSDRVGFRRIARACRFIRDDILGIDIKYLGALAFYDE